MKKIIVSIVVLLSGFICILSSLLWACSYFRCMGVHIVSRTNLPVNEPTLRYRDRSIEVLTGSGGVRCAYYSLGLVKEPFFGDIETPGIEFISDPRTEYPYTGLLNMWEWRSMGWQTATDASDPIAPFVSITIPLWVVVLTSAILPSRLLFLRWTYKRRRVGFELTEKASTLTLSDEN
jgi:hypothetical protein